MSSCLLWHVLKKNFENVPNSKYFFKLPYETTDWKALYETILLKKNSAKFYSDNSTSSLKLIRKQDTDIDNTQFGFPKSLEKREALFTLIVLPQKCLEMNQYLRFRYYNKVFDKIRHKHLTLL